MKKNIYLILFMVLLVFTLTACNSSKKENNISESKVKDAQKFKDDYEKLNGTVREKDGKSIRTLDIDTNNPFIYKSEADIIKSINNKETFIVYFGFTDCPWCRSIIPTLIEVSNDLGIGTIYYVDIKDIRDTIELDQNEKPITKVKGSDGYYTLLKLFDEVLDDYNLTNDKGEVVSTEEKRIYAPNVIAVVDGKPVKITSGISEKQKDAYMELTDEIKKDMYNKLNEVLEVVKNKSNSCNINSAC